MSTLNSCQYNEWQIWDSQVPGHVTHNHQLSLGIAGDRWQVTPVGLTHWQWGQSAVALLENVPAENMYKAWSLSLYFDGIPPVSIYLWCLRVISAVFPFADWLKVLVQERSCPSNGRLVHSYCGNTVADKVSSENHNVSFCSFATTLAKYNTRDTHQQVAFTCIERKWIELQLQQKAWKLNFSTYIHFRTHFRYIKNRKDTNGVNAWRVLSKACSQILLMNINYKKKRHVWMDTCVDLIVYLCPYRGGTLSISTIGCPAQ